MFSALFKAFTGRAGLLASVLALALIALTAAAVYFNVPRMEYKLADSGMSILQDQLTDEDELASFRAEGRNLVLEGQFADPQSLASSLKSIEGVRSVVVNGADPSITAAGEPEAAGEQVVTAVTETGIVEQADEQPVALQDATGVVEEETPAAAEQGSADAAPAQEAQLEEAAAGEEEQAASGAPVAQLESAVEAQDIAAQEDSQALEESSLSLRYDGQQLSLSGHMGDEQMAQLVVDAVRRAAPSFGELDADVDGAGKASPLNWMKEFLRAVSGLPDDAQGIIEGSDSQGVVIIPDTEQTLRAQESARPADTEATQVEEIAVEAVVSPEVEPAPEPIVSEQAPMQEAAEVVEEEPASQDQVDETEMAAMAADTESSEPVSATGQEHPGQYIVALNNRIAKGKLFETGQYTISEALAAELDGLAEMLRQNPGLLLRIVGNIDFSADSRIAEYVGIDRSRAIRDYLYRQGIEHFRLFATPLPRDRAFDKQVQVVFYISE